MELHAKFSSDINFCKRCGSSAHDCNTQHFNCLILQQKEEKEKRDVLTRVYFSVETCHIKSYQYADDNGISCERTGLMTLHASIS